MKYEGMQHYATDGIVGVYDHALQRLLEAELLQDQSAETTDCYVAGADLHEKAIQITKDPVTINDEPTDDAANPPIIVAQSLSSRWQHGVTIRVPEKRLFRAETHASEVFSVSTYFLTRDGLLKRYAFTELQDAPQVLTAKRLHITRSIIYGTIQPWPPVLQS